MVGIMGNLSAYGFNELHFFVSNQNRFIKIIRIHTAQRAKQAIPAFFPSLF